MAVQTSDKKLDGAGLGILWGLIKSLVGSLSIPSSSNLGWMWNMTDAFTIDNRFKEYESGVTKAYPKGTNVYVIEDTPADGNTPATYLFDIFQGFVDLSNYATLDDVEVLSQAEIEAICV